MSIGMSIVALLVSVATLALELTNSSILKGLHEYRVTKFLDLKRKLAQCLMYSVSAGVTLLLFSFLAIPRLIGQAEPGMSKWEVAWWCGAAVEVILLLRAAWLFACLGWTLRDSEVLGIRETISMFRSRD